MAIARLLLALPKWSRIVGADNQMLLEADRLSLIGVGLRSDAEKLRSPSTNEGELQRVSVQRIRLMDLRQAMHNQSTLVLSRPLMGNPVHAL